MGCFRKGTGQISEKISNFTIKPCGQEATSRRGSEIASGVVQGLIFFFWGGSGSQLLLLKRFRVSISSSGTVQGLNFFFWRVQGDSFFTLAASEKGPARFQRKLQILLLSHVAKRPLPGEVSKLLLGWFRVPFSSSGAVQGLTFFF